MEKGRRAEKERGETEATSLRDRKEPKFLFHY